MDGLGDEQAGCGGVQEARDVGAAAAQHEHSAEGTHGDAAPDAEPAFPDGQRAPPVVGNLVPARRQEVEASADQAGREATQGDLADELARAAPAFPSPGGERDGRDERDNVGQPVYADLERTDMHAVERRAGDRGKRRFRLF